MVVLTDRLKDTWSEYGVEKWYKEFEYGVKMITMTIETQYSNFK